MKTRSRANQEMRHTTAKATAASEQRSESQRLEKRRDMNVVLERVSLSLGSRIRRRALTSGRGEAGYELEDIIMGGPGSELFELEGVFVDSG
jgi:hypothetical protein